LCDASDSERIRTAGHGVSFRAWEWGETTFRAYFHSGLGLTEQLFWCRPGMETSCFNPSGMGPFRLQPNKALKSRYLASQNDTWMFATSGDPFVCATFSGSYGPCHSCFPHLAQSHVLYVLRTMSCIDPSVVQLYYYVILFSPLWTPLTLSFFVHTGIIVIGTTSPGSSSCQFVLFLKIKLLFVRFS